LLFLILTGSLFSLGFAQEQTTTQQIRIIHADEGTSHPTFNNTHVLTGNVQFEHDSTFMNCDSAYFFLDSNAFHAFSNVHVIKGDSISLVADTVIYRGTEKNADLFGNIIYMDREMEMRTQALHYDFNTKIGSYVSGATINSISDKNTLYSKIGSFHSDSETLYFKDSVRLYNPEYRMESDTLIYQMSSKISKFAGPTTITSKENSIYCENGWYNSDLETSSLWDNAHIETNGQKIQGDSIFYNRNEGIGKIYGNVVMQDDSNAVSIYGDYGYHHEKLDSTSLVGNALMVQYFDKDTLYLKAHQLNIKTDSTTEQKSIKAYRSVSIFKSDFQAICDSLAYSDKDSIMQFFDEPILWSDDSQITGDHINAIVKNGTIHKLDILKNAFIISKIDTVMYNQIKGKNISAFFDSAKINLVDVRGNGETLYFIQNDDSLYLEANLARCANLQVIFVNEEISSLKLLDTPTAVYQATETLNLKDKYLDHFEWLEEKRPLLESFIMLVPASE